jgi:hypothetical protein
MQAASVPPLTAATNGVPVHSAQDVKLAPVTADQPDSTAAACMFDTTSGIRAVETVQDVQDSKLTSVTTPSDTSQPAAGCDDTPPNTVRSVTFADEGAIGIKPLGTVKVYQCDGQRRKSRSWARRARLKGIVDTGATLHLLKDESTPELIDSVEGNRPVTSFSGNMSQQVAREGYQHMHFYDPQNAKKRGVTLKLPVSTMKNIEDNIFSASKLVKSMRFKCNLRPDPLEGQEPCPDDWEGFFKVQGGVLYRIPIHYDADERMWHMYYGVGVSPSDAVKDGKLNHRTQQVDLTDDNQAEYDRHAADVCIVTRHAPADCTRQPGRLCVYHELRDTLVRAAQPPRTTTQQLQRIARQQRPAGEARRSTGLRGP